MADEPTEPAAVEPTEPAAPVEPAAPAPAAEPHPLEPGGKRFNEVYAEKKALEREVAVLREQIRPAEPAKPTAPATQFYSQDHLQALVDTGKITPAQMAGQLALQAKDLAKHELRQELKHETIQSSARAEVKTYLDKMPSLNDTASSEFRKVATAAQEIAEEMGVPIDDPRVQRRALRETFGTLDRLTKATQVKDFDRKHADSYVEAGGGGGKSGGSKDPLKDVPKEYLDFWNSRGYSRERMEAEAKYVTRTPRKVHA